MRARVQGRQQACWRVELMAGRVISICGARVLWRAVKTEREIARPVNCEGRDDRCLSVSDGRSLELWRWWWLVVVVVACGWREKFRKFETCQRCYKR